MAATSLVDKLRFAEHVWRRHGLVHHERVEDLADPRVDLDPVQLPLDGREVCSLQTLLLDVVLLLQLLGAADTAK